MNQFNSIVLVKHYIHSLKGSEKKINLDSTERGSVIVRIVGREICNASTKQRRVAQKQTCGCDMNHVVLRAKIEGLMGSGYM